MTGRIIGNEFSFHGRAMLGGCVFKSPRLLSALAAGDMQSGNATRQLMTLRGRRLITLLVRNGADYDCTAVTNDHGAQHNL